MTTADMAAARSLAGKRIVITRAREQSAALSDKLRQLGAEPVECAAISIAPLLDFAELDRAILDLAGYDWVIFTSVNGVEAFLARLAQLGVGVDSGALRNLNIGAIGPATAAALEKAGCKPTFVPSRYVAEAIIEQIGDVQGCRVLLPRADIARKALVHGLREKGATVDEVAAYRTVHSEGGPELATLLAHGEIDAVTFTSSSTVRYTLDSLENAVCREQAVALLNSAALVCIGPITAATAAEQGLTVSKVAAEYTLEGLVKALVEVIGVQEA